MRPTTAAHSTSHVAVRNASHDSCTLYVPRQLHAPRPTSAAHSTPQPTRCAALYTSSTPPAQTPDQVHALLVSRGRRGPDGVRSSRSGSGSDLVPPLVHAFQLPSPLLLLLLVKVLQLVEQLLRLQKLRLRKGMARIRFRVRRKAKLQALVYDILPSTTAVFSYAIGSRKLLANEQFCWWWWWW